MLNVAAMLVGRSVVWPRSWSIGPAVCHIVVHERLLLVLNTGRLSVWISSLRGGVRIVVDWRLSKERLWCLGAHNGSGAAGFAVVDVPRAVLLVVEVVYLHVRTIVSIRRPGRRRLSKVGLSVLTANCRIICYCIAALVRMRMLILRARPVIISNEAMIVIGIRSFAGPLQGLVGSWPPLISPVKVTHGLHYFLVMKVWSECSVNCSAGVGTYIPYHRCRLAASLRCEFGAIIAGWQSQI